MTALVMIITSVMIGSILPPRVVAELELNSVKPPPDTVEEENKNNRNILKPNKPKKSRLKLKSTQNLSK